MFWWPVRNRRESARLLENVDTMPFHATYKNVPVVIPNGISKETFFHC